MKLENLSLFLGLSVALLAAGAARADAAKSPQDYRGKGTAVAPAPDGALYCEAEEFTVEKPGWQARPWGENYFAATFANTFLSRKGFLGAPEQGDETVASITADVKEAGRYLVLVRYEAPYRFETQFRVRVEQGRKTALDRLYGSRDNLKVWAFGKRLQKEVMWDWGAVENVVWEGHDAYADLQPGPARISLIAAPQKGNAGKRNVDLVMLTRDEQAVKTRIEKEGYLPLDGLMTQAGDVWVKVANTGPAKATVKAVWTDHSPYWVHMRTWKQPSIAVEPGQKTDWIEIGSAMDSLNDGQWNWESTGPCKLEFGVREANGSIASVREFAISGKLPLIGLADLRYSRKIQTQAEAVSELVDYLKKVPAHGKPPSQTLVYARCNIPEFAGLYGLGGAHVSGPKGYTDLRGQNAAQLEASCQKMSPAERSGMAVVSLGDEIGLPSPTPKAATEGFVAFLKSQGLSPKQVDPTAGDWTQIAYSPDAKLKESKPGLYYWSTRYLYHYGIMEMKQLTDALRRNLPNARIGANFSPHHGGSVHSYLGEVFKWVTCFREGGLTLPWAEDYVWQVPVGSPQMNEINLDLFRAGLRGKPDAKILYYVMPHYPGNTPNMWRRQYYGALAHGMQIVDLFEFQPVWIAYTENHVTSPPMFAEVLKGLRELGIFEDIVQAGRLRPASAGLWFSETADIWGDNEGSFGSAKRALYIAIRNHQIPLDFLVDQDAADGTLDAYRTLYLTDNHVSQAASRKIADWVKKGGRLFATAGAGMFDEYNRPNTVLRELMGVEQTALAQPGAPVGFLKQDLPFAEPVGQVAWEPALGSSGSPLQFPVFGAISHVRVSGDFPPSGVFKDGKPAIVARAAGKGSVTYCAFLPGLSFFKPAIPLKPVDRGSADDAMAHFLPIQFDAAVGQLVASAAAGSPLPVEAVAADGKPANGIETTVIESKAGMLIPVVNWTGTAAKGLTVRVNIPAPAKQVALASGAKVETRKEGSVTVCTFDLDVADALILR